MTKTNKRLVANEYQRLYARRKKSAMHDPDEMAREQRYATNAHIKAYTVETRVCATGRQFYVLVRRQHND